MTNSFLPRGMLALSFLLLVAACGGGVNVSDGSTTGGGPTTNGAEAAAGDTNEVAQVNAALEELVTEKEAVGAAASAAAISAASATEAGSGTAVAGPTVTPVASEELSTQASAFVLPDDPAHFTNALGFFDVNGLGIERAIRNDLSGGKLEGMVQFGQSHTVDPSGNEVQEMPSLVSQREALLMLTPSVPLTAPVKVMVQLAGQSAVTLTLQPPDHLPRSDVEDGRALVEYTKRAWSVAVPWHLMRQGVSLQFEDSAGQVGRLEASKMTFAAPGKLVVWGLRLGMLADPAKVTQTGNSQLMLNKPAQAAADYLQTLPASKITVASYEPQWLKRVMVDSGAIYETASPVNGDVYSGDMRENVGKATFSVGINQANYGVSSSRLGAQNPSHLTSQFVYHHSIGNYANGLQSHGLSGGNAIGTLYGSSGNEWSHEIGHHFGMGHYPGSISTPAGTNYHWAVHHADSGWGYIAYRKRMRSNLLMGNPARISEGPYSTHPDVFAQLYLYNRDSMSGGEVHGALSLYTHYTGYTAKRIQSGVMSRAWFDPLSSTGYSQDSGKGKVDAIKLGFLKASRFGVPVFTLLGGYDPNNSKAVMYPPARANYGNVYDNLPTPSADPLVDACWLEVQYADTSKRKIAIAEARLSANSANKYHVNISEQDKPLSVNLQCRKAGATQILDQQTFPDPQSLTPMEPPVVIGEDAGYDALAKLELAELDQALLAMDTTGPLISSPRTNLLLQSWRDVVSKLSAPAQAIVQKISQQTSEINQLEVWMTAHAALLDKKDPATLQTLKTHLTTAGWLTAGASLPRPGLVRGAGNTCMNAVIQNDDLVTSTVNAVATAQCDASKPAQLWIMDSRGAIHNAARLDTCLYPAQGNAIRLATCNPKSSAQAWVYGPSATPTLRSVTSQHAMDLNQSTGQIILYNYHGGGNQRWSGLAQAGNLLPMVFLSPANLRRLYDTGL